MTVLGGHLESLMRLDPREVTGSVSAVQGLSVLVRDLPLPIGALVRLEVDTGGATRACRGEVVGFNGDLSIVMLFDANDGIAPAVRVVGEQTQQNVRVGRHLLGRVIDGLGRPIDGLGGVPGTVSRPLQPPPACALDRRRIREPLPVGVRCIDGMVTIGKGQRVGVFSGPGIGKSTLLATVARNTAADVNVIALVGERGREVRDFIEDALGKEGLRRSVLVVATSDESPLLRVRAAFVACTIAEHFRDLGRDVMLVMDSVTRLAQAQRQIGLTVGEQPATKGYTPSVFAMLPRLLERAGALRDRGSITGLYAVLVEGDDLTEPVSDAARGILDGHVVLSRRLAGRGHYPAVDLLESISRVADDVCDEHHCAGRRALLRLISAYSEAEELINIGAYARGSNRDCDAAIELKPKIDDFLRQNRGEAAPYPETCRRIVEMSIEAGQILGEKGAS
ncbi:MAG: FliI/YscN family ATPase [Planctomycetes bacterium]|nr:FliI/YscN family ATPase [Planctomycetota bacterium]